MKPKFRSSFGILALFLLQAYSASAALLVYEGYQYGESANFGSLTPNEHTVGLDTSTSYSGSDNRNTNLTYNSTSMSFGNLLTTGGSVTFGTSTTILAPKSALTSSVTGNLYSSLLVNFTHQGGGGAQGFLTRITANDTDDGGAKLHSFADSRSNSTNSSIAYGSGYNSPASNAPSGLAIGVTHVVITRWTGINGDFVTSPGTGTIFALTLGQFAAMTASPDWEAYLDDPFRSVGVGDDQIAVRHNSNPATKPHNTTGNLTVGGEGVTEFFQILTTGNSGTFDEMRYGTTLESVLPLIPEPSSALLASLAPLALLRRRRS